MVSSHDQGQYHAQPTYAYNASWRFLRGVDEKPGVIKRQFVAGNGHVSKLKRGWLRKDTRHTYFFCVKDSELVWKGQGYRVVNAQKSAETWKEGDLEPEGDLHRCLRVTLEGRGGEGRQDDVVLMAFNEYEAHKWVTGLQAIAGGRPHSHTFAGESAL